MKKSICPGCKKEVVNEIGGLDKEGVWHNKCMFLKMDERKSI